MAGPALRASCRSSSRCGTRRDEDCAPLGAAGRPARAESPSGEIGDYELIIVDDASDRLRPDAWPTSTPQRTPHVGGWCTTRSTGKLGGSIKTGFANATGDLVLYTDADLPFDMDEVQKACRLMRH